MRPASAALLLLLLCSMMTSTCSSSSSRLSLRTIAKAFKQAFSDRLGRAGHVAAPSTHVEVASKIERMTKIMPRTKVTVIGGGIAGLAACVRLMQNNITDFCVLEAGDAPGGRVRTDVVEGYRLDRGFQVFIDSYPEAAKLFDYEQLELKPFLPGAVIRAEGNFHLFSDPIRRPQDIFASLNNPIGTLDDKLKVGLLSLLIRLQGYNNYVLEDRGLEAGVSTSSYLSKGLFGGLSESMIDKFFKPFYQGIFLNTLDKQSARMFRFVFKMFTIGQATLPRLGMGELASQLARRTPPGAIHYNTRAARVSRSSGDGRPATVFASAADNAGIQLEFQSDYVIVAADPTSAGRLLGESGLPTRAVPAGRGSTCVYYGIDGEPPIKKPILVLNGEDESVITAAAVGTRVNNVCFPSQVSSAYAPDGKSLCSVTILGCAEGASDADMDASVRAQLGSWFGDAADVSKWTFLRAYRVPYAQPEQAEPYSFIKDCKLSEQIYICGDHTNTATLNGAISSGTKAADAIAAEINGATEASSLRRAMASI